MSKYIQRLVNLELRDFQLIRRVAVSRGLGGKGFSAALRIIIREWEAYQAASLKSPLPGRCVAAPERGRGEGESLLAEN